MTFSPIFSRIPCHALALGLLAKPQLMTTLEIKKAEQMFKMLESPSLGTHHMQVESASMGANAGVDSGCRATKSWPMLMGAQVTSIVKRVSPIGSHPSYGGSIGSGTYEPSLIYKAIRECFLISGIHPPNITRDSSEVIKVRSASNEALTVQHTTSGIRHPFK